MATLSPDELELQLYFYELQAGNFYNLAAAYHLCEHLAFVKNSTFAKALWPGISHWYGPRFSPPTPKFRNGDLLWEESTNSMYLFRSGKLELLTDSNLRRNIPAKESYIVLGNLRELENDLKKEVGAL